MVWKSFQLVIVAEIDNFENENHFANKTQLFLSDWYIKKNKTIFFYLVFCKMPEIKIRKGISKRMALVLQLNNSARCK